MAKVFNVDSSFDYGVLAGASCAFGVFDGVHRGHRFLIDQAKQTAAENDGISVALTFDIDPDERFHADRLKKLMTNERRIAVLSQTGIDAVVVLPFTPEFSAQSPKDFLRRRSPIRFRMRFTWGAISISAPVQRAASTICAHGPENAVRRFALTT